MKPHTHGLPATLNAGAKAQHLNFTGQFHAFTKRISRVVPGCYFLVIAAASLFVFGFLIRSVYRELTWLNAASLVLYLLLFLLGLLVSITMASLQKQK